MRGPAKSIRANGIHQPKADNPLNSSGCDSGVHWYPLT
jgi:hypothetical protein